MLNPFGAMFFKQLKEALSPATLFQMETPIVVMHNGLEVTNSCGLDGYH